MIGDLLVVEDVATEFAATVSRLYAESVDGCFRIALSGGKTAGDCYAALAADAQSGVDWSKVSFFWGDERCVSLDNEASNFHLAQEVLLSHLGPVGSVHPMRCEDGPNMYDRLLRSTPPLNVVHLGLGPDGHTASLFPGSEALESGVDTLVAMNVDPLGTNPHERMTLTFAGIERADHVVITVAGADKSNALARVMAGDQSAPAARLRGAHVLWIVDQAALGQSVSR